MAASPVMVSLVQRAARSRRDERIPRTADRPVDAFVERERAASGDVVRALTVLLTNRECPWRCVMCDLWKNTLEDSVPAGAIPGQIDWALKSLGPDSTREVRQIKLYNSGSFFDAAAIPLEDHPAIAERARRFERLVVECHPALVNARVLAFRDLLGAGCRLEIAMGLETAHAATLEKLNKGMTLEQFAQAASWLVDHGIHVRAFVLVPPPFMREAEALHWAGRSIDFAFDSGAGVVSLIPTRSSGEAMKELERAGQFSQPRLSTLEAAHDYGINLRRGRVFADLWDLERFRDCEACFAARRERMHQMNLRQRLQPRAACAHCGFQ